MSSIVADTAAADTDRLLGSNGAVPANNDAVATTTTAAAAAKSVDDDNDGGAPAAVDNRHLYKYLYGQTLLGSWGDRMWEFGSFIFLIDVFPGTLLPPAVFGLTLDVFAIVFGPAAGRWIDHYDRLSVLRIGLCMQNVMVALSAACYYAVLRLDADTDGGVTDQVKWGFFCAITLTSCISKLGTLIAEVGLQRDWVVTVCGGDKHELATLNSMIRRINLLCKICAPIAVGLVSTLASTKTAVVAIAAWNVCSLLFEYNFVRNVYTAFDGLQDKGNVDADADDAGNTATTDVVVDAIADDDNAVVKSKRKKPARPSMLDSWSFFVHHRMFLASLSLSFLYMTVLAMGGNMTAYLKDSGLSDLSLSVARGVAALCGVSSTFVFPWARAKFGLLPVGLFGLWFQLLCLTLPLVRFVIYEAGEIDSTGVWLLLGGLAASRFGLWLFDMSESQLMQENVELQHVGMYGGTEKSVMHVFFGGSYIITIIWHEPRDFEYPVFVSFGCVVVACLIYTVFYLREHDNLLDSSQTPATAGDADDDAAVKLCAQQEDAVADTAAGMAATADATKPPPTAEVAAVDAAAAETVDVVDVDIDLGDEAEE